MQTQSHPFAAKLRQLRHLEKCAKRWADDAHIYRREHLIRKLKRLVGRLHGVHTKWWLKTALSIALYLQVNLQDVRSQDFNAPVYNPFGIVDVETVYFHKAADMDNDGDLDIIGMGYSYDSEEIGMYYFENTGSPSDIQYAAPVNNAFGLSFDGFFDANVVSFGVADMDNDGDLDILAGNYYDYYYDQNFAYFENTGTPEVPQFGQATFFSIGSAENIGTGFIQLADIDDDGDYDMFASSFVYEYNFPYYEEGVQTVFYENTGTPEEFAFAEAQVNPFGIITKSSDVLAFDMFGDLDGDGDLDLLSHVANIYSYNTQFYYQENIGSSTEPVFSQAVINAFNLTSGSGVIHIGQLVDFDDDGDQDILSSAYWFDDEIMQIAFFENDQTSDLPDLAQAGVIVEIAPNPVADILSFELKGLDVQEPLQLAILSNTGRIVHSRRVLSSVNHVDLTEVPAGVYTLRLHNGSGQLARSFVKVE